MDRILKINSWLIYFLTSSVLLLMVNSYLKTIQISSVFLMGNLALLFLSVVLLAFGRREN